MQKQMLVLLKTHTILLLTTYASSVHNIYKFYAQHMHYAGSTYDIRSFYARHVEVSRTTYAGSTHDIRKFYVQYMYMIGLLQHALCY
jgi:hypothetical protein